MWLPLHKTDALEAHRNDLGSRALLGRQCPEFPRHRFDPFPSYVVDWTESVMMALSVATLTQETQTGRVIFGPFRLGQITLAQSGTDLRNLKAAISLRDSDAESAVALDLYPTAPTQYISDTTDQTPGFGAALATLTLTPSRIIYPGTGRVSLVVMNQTAATISVAMTAIIEHLRPITPDLIP